MNTKKPNGLITDTVVFLLWGWISVLRKFLAFRSLENKARRALGSEDAKHRGYGRSIITFMSEQIYFEISYLHKRGGWLANRHIDLIDYAVSVNSDRKDLDAKSIDKWKVRNYETIGFAGPNRVLLQSIIEKHTDKPEKTEPLVIREMVKD